MEASIYVSQNRVMMTGILRMEIIPELMRQIDRVVTEARYPDIIIDASKAEATYGSFLTALLARLVYLKKNRTDVEFIEPTALSARSFIERTNFLAILLDDAKRRKPYRPDKPLPIFHYVDADEQGRVVECITKSLLFQIPNLDRRQLQAAQWALFEITDNVLNHANSITGGFAFCQIHHNLKLVEVTVVDSGIGIARSLSEPDQGIALQKAISEGVTRNKETNQGNGLYGTWRLATLSKGIFIIHSRRGRLFVRKEGTVKVENRASNFPGTIVLFQIDYSDVNLISHALTFDGKLHAPAYDFIEQHFESTGTPHTVIKLREHVLSTGSREAGRKLATLINNVIRMSEDAKVDVDFTDILIVSSSFADECFGRLIAQMGPSEFFSKITFVNTDTAIRAIIDRSVLQRLRLNG